MANYGSPDYSKAGGNRDRLAAVSRATSSSLSVDGSLKSPTDISDVTTLDSSSLVAIIYNGQVYTTAASALLALGGGGGGGGAVYWQEVSLGSTPATGGSFTITLLDTATVGSMVFVQELPNTLVNGELGDRAEADPVTYSGIVTGSTTATIYWAAPWVVSGTRAIAYEVRALV